MKTIGLIARREWLAIICSRTGLIIIGLYLCAAGYWFWLDVSVSQQATLRYTFGTLGTLTLLVVPLITMRLVAAELRSGTFEVLTSYPVSDMHIVLGKFVAGWGAFLALSIPTLAYLVILQAFGSPDWGPALCAYLGQQMLAIMLLSLGLLISSITANQVLAAIGTLAGGILLAQAGSAKLSLRGWSGDTLAYLAMFEHFDVFRRGIIDTRDLTYFGATAALLLYLAVRAIESRRWRFGVLPSEKKAPWAAPWLCAVLFGGGAGMCVDSFVQSATEGFWTNFNTLLAILGGSISLTPIYLNRHRIRSDFSRRHVGRVLTVAVNCMLVTIIWGLALFFTSRHPVRADFTHSKHYALSDQTLKVLKSLAIPVDVTVVVNQPADLRQEIMDLLAEFKARSRQITVSGIDPIRDLALINDVRQRYKLTSPPGDELLLAIGGQCRRLPVASLVEQQSHYVNGRLMPIEVPQFVGEAEITGNIIQMTRTAPGRVVFLAGHAERNPDDIGDEGISRLAQQLRNGGWLVNTQIVTLGANAAFPADTSIVVIAGPQNRISDEDLRALQSVLDRGGGVLALVDPGVKAGMEPLFNAWDVRLTDDMIVDLRNHLASGDPTSLYVTHFLQEDPIGKGMGALPAVLPMARRVQVNTTDPNPTIHSSNFMHTSGDAWAVAYQPGEKPAINPSRDFHSRLSLGLACERWQRFPEPGHPPLQGRLVVIGDSDFASNHYVDMAGNLNLFLNCVEWLAGRQELISVRPKVADVRRMTLTAGQARLIFWLSMALVPGATLFGRVAIVRRRYRA